MVGTSPTTTYIHRWEDGRRLLGNQRLDLHERYILSRLHSVIYLPVLAKRSHLEHRDERGVYRFHSSNFFVWDYQPRV